MSRLIWNTRSAFPNYSYITVSKVIIPQRSIFKTTNSCAFSSSTVAKEEDEHTALTREKVGNDTFREVLEEKKVNNDISMYRNVFKYKTTFEIVRALFVFRLCANQTLVRHSPKLMDVGRKLLGKRLFNRCMKLTFYGQFVAGETKQELLRSVQALEAVGVQPILCVPMEEDIDGKIDNSKYERNTNMVEESIILSRDLCRNNIPVAQVKLTALIPGRIVETLSRKVPNPAEDQEMIDIVKRHLDGEDEVRFDCLDVDDAELLQKGLQRARRIGQLSRKLNVRLLIDAEYTYLNPALRLISLAMMLQYNDRREPVIAYTYQNYLKRTYDEVVEDLLFVTSRGAGFGAKIVRGAYMEKERKLAKMQGYEDPVHENFEATTCMYNQTLDLLLDRVRVAPDLTYLIVASHNEETVNYAQKQMEARGLAKNHPSVMFGQVYGMADFLSGRLGQLGYGVYKSIPYGPVEDTLPYLQRRAVENSSLLGGTSKERKILWNTLQSRLPRYSRREE